jgi:hypothetical protein
LTTFTLKNDHERKKIKRIEGESFKEKMDERIRVRKLTVKVTVHGKKAQMRISADKKNVKPGKKAPKKWSAHLLKNAEKG